ncbi:lipoprotein [Melittangium boletus DSM 14713]|uniref:Lipoprotein n=2 Tax=Melittangium boletus TaxID=83453 RepID=A0A250I840_9BACT|nr:lipoprotein [Melittangium boletus DSM 14713]
MKRGEAGRNGLVMPRPSLLAFLLCVSPLLPACIVEAPGGASPNERRQAVVAEVPPLSVKGGANFEDTVELVGASVQPGRLTPGDVARVTAYFKVLKPLDEDYIVFVHVEDAEGRMERVNVDHKPAGGLYPTTQWKPGETVKDEFAIAIPATSPARTINLWMGFWDPKTDGRLQLKNPEAVRNDGRSRILLMQIPVAR